MQDFTDFIFRAKMKSANLIALLLGVSDARTEKETDLFFTLRT